jgi:hypothetical protein
MRRAIPFLFLRFWLLGCVLFSALARAESTLAKELSAPVAAELGQLRTLTDARSYGPARALIERLLPQVADPSYDLALLSQVQGQLLLAEGRYEPALAPLQRAAELGERHGLFEPRTLLETLYLLGQLNAHLAAEATRPELKQRYWAAAHAAITRWLARTPTPNVEVQLFAASILYQQALLDPAKPDFSRLQAARLAAEECLLLEATPREASYVMVLAIQQQLGQREAAADTLELLVKAHPGKALYWQQLAGSYLTLAADSADSAEAAASATTCRPQLRALLTLERAQALGHLTSDVDQANANALRALLSQPTAVTAHAL